MAGRVPYVKRRKYTHMTREERDVWERFMEAFPERFESADYDFRVGEGEIPPEDYNENYKRMVTQLSQLRIDVVVWYGDQATIVEVKERALVSAVGQLSGYRVLWMRDLQNLGKPHLLMVCGKISEDAKEVFKAMNIPVEVV